MDNKIFTIYNLQFTGFDCFWGSGILQNLGTDARLRKKTIYGYVQGLGGYSRDPGLARNTLQVSGKRQISLHDTGIDRYSVFGMEMTEVRGAGLW